MSTTFYWHDYETFGSRPDRARPAQFAGIRTDLSFDEIGEPLTLYCQPTDDVLPEPGACLVTGITPQMAAEQGVPEFEFIRRIHAELAQPGTCGVGYNSVRFDDEVTRYTLYRNFYDPYAREWEKDNSRWDLINVMRMTYALRPDGIKWPLREDGYPSFKLVDLAKENDIPQDQAHDALSDAQATLGLARLVRQKQPRLFEWLFQLRDKNQVNRQLNLSTHQPVLYAAHFYPAKIGCTSMVMPLFRESTYKNHVLVYDLRQDPSLFLGMNEDQLHECWLAPAAEAPKDRTRLPIQSVRINQCPALAPLAVADASTAERIELDLEACNRHLDLIHSSRDFIQRIHDVYHAHKKEQRYAPRDVDTALYENLLDNDDRALFPRIRETAPEQLADLTLNFGDRRFPELLFRYRARNWSDTLSEDEKKQWEQFCHDRLHHGVEEGELTLAQYREKIAQLLQEHENNPRERDLLSELQAWGDHLEQRYVLGQS